MRNKMMVRISLCVTLFLFLYVNLTQCRNVFGIGKNSRKHTRYTHHPSSKHYHFSAHFLAHHPPAPTYLFTTLKPSPPFHSSNTTKSIRITNPSAPDGLSEHHAASQNTPLDVPESVTRKSIGPESSGLHEPVEAPAQNQSFHDYLLSKHKKHIESVTRKSIGPESSGLHQPVEAPAQNQSFHDYLLSKHKTHIESVTRKSIGPESSGLHQPVEAPAQNQSFHDYLLSKHKTHIGKHTRYSHRARRPHYPLLGFNSSSYHPTPPIYHFPEYEPSPSLHHLNTTKSIGIINPSAPDGPSKHHTSVQSSPLDVPDSVTRKPIGSDSSGSNQTVEAPAHKKHRKHMKHRGKHSRLYFLPSNYHRPTYNASTSWLPVYQRRVHHLPARHFPGFNSSAYYPSTFSYPSYHSPTLKPSTTSHSTNTSRSIGIANSSSPVEPSIHDTSMQNSLLNGQGNYGQNTSHNKPYYNPARQGQPPYNLARYRNASVDNPSEYAQPQGNYHTAGAGGGVVIINNNANNHHISYEGGNYGESWPHYHYSPAAYTIHDTGNSVLGFYLGYSLGSISTTPYNYHILYDYGNTPRYDHYTVHHYYHNKESIPKETTIQPYSIVACVGNSGSFCPTNTTSLCTRNGTIMCVTNAVLTVPCSKEKGRNCVNSSIPCENNDALECKGSSKEAANVTIPCISTAKVYGEINFINNSIVISNSTKHENTALEKTLAVNTSSSSGNVTTAATTVITTTEYYANATIAKIRRDVTDTVVNETTTNNGRDAVRESVQTFCVTILVLPAEMELTQEEKVSNNTKRIF